VDEPRQSGGEGARWRYPLIQDLNITQQPPTSSFQTANFSVDRDASDLPYYEHFKNVPSRGQDRRNQAHPGSKVSQLASEPNRLHSHITRTRYLRQLQPALRSISEHLVYEINFSASPTKLPTNTLSVHAFRAYIHCCPQSEQDASNPGHRRRWAPGTPAERHAAGKRPTRNILRTGERQRVRVGGDAHDLRRLQILRRYLPLITPTPTPLRT